MQVQVEILRYQSRLIRWTRHVVEYPPFSNHINWHPIGLLVTIHVVKGYIGPMEIITVHGSYHHTQENESKIMPKLGLVLSMER